MPSYKILPSTTILEDLRSKLSTIRTNRINASILDHIVVPVPAWGGEFKIIELATVNLPQPGVMTITPFDIKASLQAIEKAVRDSNLGVNPVNDGAGLRINFPAVTTEEREKRAKLVKEYGEESRIRMRKNRQELMQEQKALKEKSEITEDDLRRFETDLQKEVDNLNQEIDTIIKNKQDEILKI